MKAEKNQLKIASSLAQCAKGVDKKKCISLVSNAETYDYVTRFRKHAARYLLATLAVAGGLSGCGGGGGGDTAGGVTPTTVHVASDVNNQKALLASAINQNTYTLDVRQSGVMTVGSGDPYSLSFTVPVGIDVVTNTCAGRTLHYGADCQLTVNVLTRRGHVLDSANGYRAEQLMITIDATNTVTGEVVRQTIPVSVVNNPLTAAVAAAAGANIGVLLEAAYHTANISEEDAAAWLDATTGAQFVYPFNVPLIHTYDSQVTNTPLAMETRCGNTLVYFVAQQKLGRLLVPIGTGNQDNVIVKYHPLIADGVTSGVAGNSRVLDGHLTILETGQPAITHNTSANAHDSPNLAGPGSHGTWSGPENIDRLRELITTATTPNNSTVISILNGLSGARLIDVENAGATKVITVHSLLTGVSADALRLRLAGGTDIVALTNTLLASGVAADQELGQALVEYQNQVAKACYI
ncbi:hypothetical protein [Caedibacter taeniospiralis]|uniref:hypothetical protein n=1 Tax=Caedibacter taeniospiralis TaxID=28907 RepID=UPI000C27FEDC|nr:hypothetical protein [Caedibacter taeniospiralis]